MIYQVLVLFLIMNICLVIQRLQNYIFGEPDTPTDFPMYLYSILQCELVCMVYYRPHQYSILKPLICRPSHAIFWRKICLDFLLDQERSTRSSTMPRSDSHEVWPFKSFHQKQRTAGKTKRSIIIMYRQTDAILYTLWWYETPPFQLT